MKPQATKKEIQDIYFMDSRAKLLDIAAFLDRVDRHSGEADFRHPAFLKALEAMQNPPAGRTRAQAVLDSLSDETSAPIPAATFQGAFGAVKA